MQRGSLDASVLLRLLSHRAQPQRHMRWLHRLLHHCYQLLAELVEIDFAAQRGVERLQCPGGIVLATVEAPVNDVLNATAQGLEEDDDQEC